LYYDDGYKQETKIEKAELPDGYVRAVRLENGMVMQINDLLLEFEDNILYEVEPAKTWLNPFYERTGRSFTMEQINQMSNEV
jgi:hypothetical protein